MAEHSTLTGANLHENKGVASATDNTVASATSGATVWRKVNANMLDTTSIFGTNKEYLQVELTDVSTTSVAYVVVPFTGTLTQVYSVLHSSITVADSIVSVLNNAGASAGTFTVSYSGSAAGDIDSLTPVANNTFTAGQRLAISTDGGSTTAARLTVTLAFTVTA